MATGSDDGTVIIWDIQHIGMQVLKHESPVVGICFSGDGNHFYTACYDKKIRQFSTQDFKLVKTFAGHDDEAVSVAVSPDSKIVASGGYDNVVRLWDAKTGSQIKVLKGL